MNEESQKTIKNLPREKAFYFFTSIGNYTGESAMSLKEFMGKINEVDVKSLEFHLYRGDFEKWVNEALEDAKLSVAIGSLRNQNYFGTTLREHLYSIVSKRCKELNDDFGSTPTKN
ncbi:MAG TPA: DUF5752 family protein [Candidatus Bathyarchaeia archaeon]